MENNDENSGNAQPAMEVKQEQEQHDETCIGLGPENHANASASADTADTVDTYPSQYPLGFETQASEEEEECVPPTPQPTTTQDVEEEEEDSQDSEPLSSRLVLKRKYASRTQLTPCLPKSVTIYETPSPVDDPTVAAARGCAETLHRKERQAPQVKRSRSMTGVFDELSEMPAAAAMPAMPTMRQPDFSDPNFAEKVAESFNNLARKVIDLESKLSQLDARVILNESIVGGIPGAGFRAHNRYATAIRDASRVKKKQLERVSEVYGSRFHTPPSQ